MYYILNKFTIENNIYESFSERVSELTHPKLPIYSFEIGS